MNNSKNLHQSTDDVGNTGAHSQYILACQYLSGDGVYKNTQRGIEYLLTLAIHSESQLAVRRLYQEAEQGDPEAQYHFGCLYLDGRSVVLAEQAAYVMYIQGARIVMTGQGERYGTDYLAKAVKQKHKLAVQRLYAEAEQGNAWAVYHIKYLFLCNINATQIKYFMGAAIENSAFRECLQNKIYRDDFNVAFKLGCLFFMGVDVARDVELGMRYLVDAATHGCKLALAFLHAQANAQNNAEMQYHLGCLYLDNTHITPLNSREGVRYLIRACEQGHKLAMQRLKQQANQGDFNAKLNFIILLFAGTDVTRDEKYGTQYLLDETAQGCDLCKNILQREARRGNASVQYYLGRLYLWGSQGIQQNTKLGIKYLAAAAAHRYKLAAKCLQLEAKQGDAYAQCAFGHLLLSGVGMQPNTRRGINYLTGAAVQGNADAQYKLGCLYLRSQHTAHKVLGINYLLTAAVHKNILAKVHLQKQADQGIAIAQYEFGCLCLQDGKLSQRGLKYWANAAAQGYGLAVKSLRLEAKRGSAVAQYELGCLHLQGNGIQQNTQRGLQYLVDAAAQEYAPAMLCLQQKDYQIRTIVQYYFRYLYLQAKSAVHARICSVWRLASAFKQKFILGFLRQKIIYNNTREHDTHLLANAAAQGCRLATRSLQQKARRGIAVAQYEFSRLCLKYASEQQKTVLGIQYLVSAAAQGHILAILNLQREAKRDNASAQYHFGSLLLNGTGIPQNIEHGIRYLANAATHRHRLAAQLLQQKAIQGKASAQYYYACLLLDGVVVQPNVKRGVEYLVDAVTQGHQLAAKRLRREAGSGNAAAQYDIGCLVLAGKVVVPDRMHVIGYLAMSAALGNTLALQNLQDEILQMVGVAPDKLMVLRRLLSQSMSASIIIDNSANVVDTLHNNTNPINSVNVLSSNHALCK